jgi:hypothetical protein
MAFKIFGTNIVKLEARFGLFFMLMAIYRILLVSNDIFMEVGCGQRGKTCSCGKGSKKYSEENSQLPANTKERKD